MAGEIENKASASNRVEVEVEAQSLGLNTFSVRWLGGWEEKLTSAKVEVEVEAELEKKNLNTIYISHMFQIVTWFPLCQVGSV